MTAEARANGWDGFNNIAERIPKAGYRYKCDGMPSMMGCGETVDAPRKWQKTGKKKSGWVVCYGLTGPDDVPFDQHTEKDLDVVLTFCPSCAASGSVIA